MFEISQTNQNATLRVCLKLGVSFSPLHADRHHPVENKETSARHGVKKEERKHRKEHVHLLRQGAFEEEITNADAIFHISLQHSSKLLKDHIC